MASTAHPRPWWREAVIYQICIRSFADGDGDGIGDIAGIPARLPYLRDLGVDATWITPWYRSPMADGGYVVADYRDIDPPSGRDLRPPGPAHHPARHQGVPHRPDPHDAQPGRGGPVCHRFRAPRDPGL